jgi:hypothetical protein
MLEAGISSWWQVTAATVKAEQQYRLALDLLSRQLGAKVVGCAAGSAVRFLHP